MTRPRFSAPSAFTFASRSGHCSSGTSRPRRSTASRIESIPLFLPSTTERSAATSSDEYGSIAGGSWNWLATAPLSRVKRFSPTTGFHGSSGVPETSATQVRDLAGAIEAQVRRDAVERVERERDLDQVGVAAALAHAVDRPLHPGRAGADGGGGRGGREPEVVVAVEVDRDVRPEPLARAADEVGDRLGRRDPDRVDDDRFLRARLDRGLVRLAEELEVGAGAVDAEVRDGDAVLRRERDRVADPLEH